MSDCIHEEVCGTCDVEPKECGYYEQRRGKCVMHRCDGGFASTDLPVWRCDCGAFVTQYTDMTTFRKPRYCPNCGRAVVDD